MEQDQVTGGTSTRAIARLAWALCAVSLLILALSLLLIVLGWSTPLPGARTPWRDQAVSVVGIIGAPVLGGLIASRRPKNPYGWVWSIFGLGLSLQLLAGAYASYALVEPGSLVAPRMIPHLLNPGGPLALTLGSFLMLLFPTGRLPSPRWRFVAWTAGVSGAVLIALSFFFISPDQAGGLVSVVAVVVASALFVSVFLSALSLVARYRQANGVERQQLRWLAGAAVLIGVYIVGGLIGLDRQLGEGVWNLINAVANAGLYAAVGIAILRYRLYEIDIIINRALVYGSLTVMLVGVYFGGIVVLQRVFVAITGQQSTLAVVASTLAIAALFNPLRRRVQALVDRRFYRRKYNSAKTLAAFNNRLREETDLDSLGEQVLGVVRETLQPKHASLWLRPHKADAKKDVPG
jgi:hypothetical protein